MGVEASLLGQATVAAGLSPQQGLEVYAALSRAREGLSLVDECHLLFQLTPVYLRLRPDQVRLERMLRLSYIGYST